VRDFDRTNQVLAKSATEPTHRYLVDLRPKVCSGSRPDLEPIARHVSCVPAADITVKM
jgi:hypothetical protein